MPLKAGQRRDNCDDSEQMTNHAHTAGAIHIYNIYTQVLFIYTICTLCTRAH